MFTSDDSLGCPANINMLIGRLQYVIDGKLAVLFCVN